MLRFVSEFISGNCDFEQDGFCEWRQVYDGSDDFDWTIHSGLTPSIRTGPFMDHTTGTREGAAFICLGFFI